MPCESEYNFANVYMVDVASGLPLFDQFDHIYESVFDVISETPTYKSGCMSTIGLPLYVAEHLHGENAYEEYFRANSEINTFLVSRFKTLYRGLATSLSEFFNMSIHFHPQLAIPGFHLFRSAPEEPFSGGGWHVDGFGIPHSVTRGTLWSITLLLGQKNSEFGIEFKSSSESDAIERHAHRRGIATVFRSNRLHRIAPIACTAPTNRLTLQAHLSVNGRSGVLFW